MVVRIFDTERCFRRGIIALVDLEVDLDLARQEIEERFGKDDGQGRLLG